MGFLFATGHCVREVNNGQEFLQFLNCCHGLEDLEDGEDGIGKTLFTEPLF